MWTGVRLGPDGFAKPVAVKSLLPAFVRSAPHVRAFLHEARTASHVQHRSVVQIRELLLEEDRYWLSMELVRGWSLRRLLGAVHAAGRPIPLEVAIALAREVAAGLHAIHESGLIHRHVAPENIMVSTSGHVVVLDFGCADWQLAQQVRFTPPLVELAPAYASPQMIAGERLDARTDLYSLGALLHELVFGVRPSPAPTARSPHRDDVPMALDDLIARSLDRDPAARFSSAREIEMVLELISFRHGWPVTSSYVGAYLDEVFLRSASPQVPPWPSAPPRPPPAPRPRSLAELDRFATAEPAPLPTIAPRAPSELEKTRVRLRRRPTRGR